MQVIYTVKPLMHTDEKCRNSINKQLLYLYKDILLLYAAVWLHYRTSFRINVGRALTFIFNVYDLMHSYDANIFASYELTSLKSQYFNWSKK